MPAPCNAKPISLGFTPWNEIRPKKYFSPGLPVVPLWQNSCNLSCAIPLGFTPPVEDTVCGAPWNLYPARNVNTNGHIEVKCFNLLKPDGTIPLGPSILKKVFQKAPPTQCSWSFFTSIL
jgi:hypothetical protein